MESRSDVRSILPFIPLIARSSSLVWPPRAIDSLKALALGPDISRVDSGEAFFVAAVELRQAVGIESHPIARNAADGYAIFFDELMSRTDSRSWFGEVVPQLARLLLQLPSLLEAHYLNADEKFGERKAGLRILGEEEGIVFLSQELIAALLACAMFCLFPTRGRGSRCLPPTINFDYLFAALQSNTKSSQEHKVRCLVHYFERICLDMPSGYVSFHRKVLPLKQGSNIVPYPKPDFWRKSCASLCSFKVCSSGFIEDQQQEALEVDFANEYLGGGALHRGCVQEEIRFMINPELITGMLFMASMEVNEAIEIVGAERFSSYTGYGSTFQFLGNHVDYKPHDSLGRRKTTIIAIDALCNPGMRQYEVEYLVRETNKAFVGFMDQSNYLCYLKLFQITLCEDDISRDGTGPSDQTSNSTTVYGTSSETEISNKFSPTNNKERQIALFRLNQSIDSTDNVGIATGNWGCGAFGGDSQIKSIIQWLAASQALRPFVHYYTFGDASLKRLEEVTKWILSHGWTVGDLWSMLVEYSSQRLNGKTNDGFLNWILPASSVR